MVSKLVNDHKRDLAAHAKFIGAMLDMATAYYDLWSAAYDSRQERPHVDRSEWEQWNQISDEWHERAKQYATDLGVAAIMAMPCAGDTCDHIDRCFLHDIAHGMTV